MAESRSVTVVARLETEETVKRLGQLQNTYLSTYDKIRKAMKNGESNFKPLNDTIAKTTKETKQLSGSILGYWKNFETGGKSINELKAAQSQLNRVLKDLDPRTDLWKELSSIHGKVKDDLDGLQKKLKSSHATWGEWWKKYANVAMGVDATLNIFKKLRSALSSVTGWLQSQTQEWLIYSDKMAEVQRAASMTAEDVKALGESLKKIDTRTSQNQLMDLAVVAGRMGLTAKEDVEGFVKAVDQIKVALGSDFSDDAIVSMGRLADMMGTTKDFGIEKAYLKVASAVNSLGIASSANEAKILEFATKTAGVGKAAGLSVDQLLAFGSAFDQMNVDASRGAMIFQTLISKMADPKNFETFARVAGKSVGDFTNLLQTDFNKAIQTVLASIKQKGGFDSLAPIFKEMGMDGAKSVETLSKLADQIDKVTEAQQVSSKAFTEGKSVTDTFNVTNNTAAAQAEKLKKQLTNMKVEIGEKLTPALLGLSKTFLPLAKHIPTTSRELASFGIAFAGLKLKTHTKSIAEYAAGLKVMRTGTERATISVKALGKALKSVNVAVILSAIAALVGVISHFVSRAREAKKAFNEFMAGMNTEVTKVNNMFDALRKAKEGTEQYATARKAIIDQYGEYLGGLVNEKGELNDLEAAYKRVTAAVKDKWAAQQIEAETDKINNKSFEKQGDLYERIRKQLPANIDQNAFLSELKQAIDENSNYFKVLEKYGVYFKNGKDNKRGFSQITYDAINIKQLEWERARNVKGVEDKYGFYRAKPGELQPLSIDEQIAQKKEKLQKALDKKSSIKSLQDMGISVDEDSIKKEIDNLQADIVRLQSLQTFAGGKKTKTGDIPGVNPNPEPEGDNSADAVESIRERNQEMAETVQEGMDANASIRKTAEEKEIEAVEKKYEALLKKETAFQKEMQKIINDSTKSQAERDAARQALNASKQRVSGFNPAKEKEIQQVRLRYLQEANQKAEAMYQDLLRKGEEALMSANELEIAQVKAKYAKELKEAQEYVNKLQKLKDDANASKEERDSAEAALPDALKWLDGIKAAMTTEIAKVQSRQSSEGWMKLFEDAKSQKQSTQATAKGRYEERNRAIDDFETAGRAKIDEASQENERAYQAASLLPPDSEQYCAAMDACFAKDQEIAQMQIDLNDEVNRQRAESNAQYEAEKLSGAMQGIQMLQQALSAASNAMSDIKQMELDKANAQYEKDKKNLDNQLKKKQISQATYNKKMEKLEEEKEAKQKEIRKKYQLAEMLMTIAQIGSATALACMNAWAAYAEMPPVAAAMTAISVAMGAVETGLAIAQYNAAKGYKTGGPTGEGALDEPAGIVHKGEYVVPNWVLKTPKGMNYVGVLEAIRTNKTTGYAGGGYVPGAARSTGSATGTDGAGSQTLTISQAAGSAVLTREEAAELLALTRSIDTKLNGVSLVYLDSQLKDLNRNYQQMNKDFGLRIP